MHTIHTHNHFTVFTIHLQIQLPWVSWSARWFWLDMIDIMENSMNQGTADAQIANLFITISDLATISVFPISLLSICYPITPRTSLSLVTQFLPSFALLVFCFVFLSVSVFWLVFPPHLCASSHLFRKGEKKREYTIRKLLSHTVQEGDSMSKIKQFSFTSLWMHSLCLTFSHHFSPPSPFTKSFSISSIPPPPFSIFSHLQSAVTLVYPAWIPLQPSKPYQPK